MASVCFFFSMHEPFILRRYSVFDLGQNSLYEDDEKNCARIRHLAQSSYLPAIDLLLRQVERQHGEFRFSCHVSLPALQLFEQYTPEVVQGLQSLAATKCVEFVAGAAHSLAFLYSRQEFCRQLTAYSQMTQRVFKQKPSCFCSTELIYNNDFAACLESMGFSVMLAEGTDHILGWRSPNFVYAPEGVDKICLLLRNRRLSRDLYLRFSDRSWDQWPLTAEKYARWCATAGQNSDVINLFTNMNMFGVLNARDSGIFEFMEQFPEAALKQGLNFATPNEAVKRYPVRDSIDVKQFVSWDDAGGDLNSWLGNDMQKDAVHFLYSLTQRVHDLNDPVLLQDFTRLQVSNYLRWMSTKWFSSNMVREASPFANAQEAYTTYMNILADFEMRIEHAEENSKKSDMNQEAKKTPRTVEKEQRGRKSVEHEQLVA
ncbi:MAG: glycoside hydrolase family 57 protein [Desulfovibrio sp.]|nr:glycoside hydrolase family 57 protein [Desulfovibrio sp.]